MKILVFGTTGQLARELQRHIGSDRLVALGRDEADFTDPQACAEHVLRSDADVIINAVAYTAVDRAEDEENLATVIKGHFICVFKHKAPKKSPLSEPI